MTTNKKMTTPQQRLYRVLPDVFYVVVDYRKSDCPGTVIVSEDGNEVYRFGAGDQRAFDSLVRNNHLVCAGGEFIDEVATTLYGKE